MSCYGKDFGNQTQNHSSTFFITSDTDGSYTGRLYSDIQKKFPTDNVIILDQCLETSY